MSTNKNRLHEQQSFAGIVMFLFAHSTWLSYMLSSEFTPPLLVLTIISCVVYFMLEIIGEEPRDEIPACEHPDMVTYRMTSSKGEDKTRKVCNKCGLSLDIIVSGKVQLLPYVNEPTEKYLVITHDGVPSGSPDGVSSCSVSGGPGRSSGKGRVQNDIEITDLKTVKTQTPEQFIKQYGKELKRNNFNPKKVCDQIIDVFAKEVYLKLK